MSLAVVWRLSDSLPVDDDLAVIESIRAQCDSREAMLLAARMEAGATQRSVESLLQRNDKTSKRTAKKRTRRAKAVKRNPTIATKMKSGELSPDQADVLANGAEKTDGAAAEHDDLIETIANTPPDQAKKVVDEWVREHTTREQVQDAHDRQRRLRNVRRWTTDRGTDVLALEGDTATLDQVETAIRNRSSQLYRSDGGRDLPAGEHPCTRDQRNYDAAVDLLTRTTGDNPTKGNGKGKGAAAAYGAPPTIRGVKPITSSPGKHPPGGPPMSTTAPSSAPTAITGYTTTT